MNLVLAAVARHPLRHLLHRVGAADRFDDFFFLARVLDSGCAIAVLVHCVFGQLRFALVSATMPLLQRLGGRRNRFLAGLGFGGRLLDRRLVRDGEVGGRLRRLGRRRGLVLRNRLAAQGVGCVLGAAATR